MNTRLPGSASSRPVFTNPVNLDENRHLGYLGLWAAHCLMAGWGREEKGRPVEAQKALKITECVSGTERFVQSIARLLTKSTQFLSILPPRSRAGNRPAIRHWLFLRLPRRNLRDRIVPSTNQSCFLHSVRRFLQCASYFYNVSTSPLSTLHPQNEYKFFLNNTAVAMTIAVMAG